MDVVRSQSLRDAEVFLQGHVNARHHVLHNFDGRIPNPELLPEFWVKGLEKRFVEVGYRLALGESSKERTVLYPL